MHPLMDGGWCTVPFRQGVFCWEIMLISISIISSRRLFSLPWRDSRGCSMNLFHRSIRTILSYLQHRDGQTWNRLISTALSSCTNKIDGAPVGKHPGWLGGSLVTDYLICSTVPRVLLRICWWSWWLSLKDPMNLCIGLHPDCSR